MLCDLGGDNKRNLVGTTADADGDVEAVFADCDIVLERTYHTKAFNQAIDGDLPHVYRAGPLRASACDLVHADRVPCPPHLVPCAGHPEKPHSRGEAAHRRRFGAKQTAVCEVYPAFVTMKTGRPAMCVFTRKEAQTCGSPRHEMEIKVRLGANDDGRIRALDVTTLSNSARTASMVGRRWVSPGTSPSPCTPGTWRHSASPTTWCTQPAVRRGLPGLRGHSGIFAVESAVNELAARLGMDPVELRKKNMVREGQTMPAYYNEPASACALDRCLAKCAERFGWAEKYPVRDMGGGKIRAAGVAIAMQVPASPGWTWARPPSSSATRGSITCPSARRTWGPGATPSWPRWSPSIWNAPWMP